MTPVPANETAENWEPRANGACLACGRQLTRGDECGASVSTLPSPSSPAQAPEFFGCRFVVRGCRAGNTSPLVAMGRVLVWQAILLFSSCQANASPASS